MNLKIMLLALAAASVPASSAARDFPGNTPRSDAAARRDAERARMRDKGLIGGLEFCGGLGLSSTGYAEAKRLLRKEGEGPESSTNACTWLNVPGREHLLYLVAVEDWRAIEKADERFAVGVLKPGDRVRGPEHDYVSPGNYDKVQREKSRQYGDLMEKIMKNLSKS